MEKDKTIISLQLPDFAIQWLKQKAEEECTSVSAIIRKMVVQKIRSEEVDK